MHNDSAAAELQHLLTIPPSSYTGNPQNTAAVAHASLQALRDSGDERYLFLRSTLELDPKISEELLFHCISCCRHTILHKWTTLHPSFLEKVRDFFMSWPIQQALPRTIQLACYSTAVSFWKRIWNEPSSQMPSSLPPNQQALMDLIQKKLPAIVSLKTKDDLFQYMESSLPNSLEQACTFLSVLVGEFCGKSGVSYNLPLEFHKRAHGAFEPYLDSCLKLSMSALGQCLGGTTATENSAALAAVQLTVDVLSWEFGANAFDGGMPHTTTKSLIRPPELWRDYLVTPNVVGAIVHAYERVANSQEKLGHALLQLLLLLASMTGPILPNAQERTSYCAHLVESALKLLARCTQDSTELVDVLSIVSRIICNFKLATLVELPTLPASLQAMANTGTSLLQANVVECEGAQGDVETMENVEWRQEALSVLLDGTVLMCADPWLFYSSNDSRMTALQALSTSLSPLYNAFVTCRIRMARLEEYYLTAHAAELDEVREEISALDLEEEMASVAAIARISLVNGLNCLSSLFETALPQVQALWETSGQAGDVSPEGAACLEEVRLLVKCLGHLLTDDNSGETPIIPESIVMTCRGNDATAHAISSAVQTIMTLAEMQASKIRHHASDPRLSPLVATSFLWFFHRWAPAYIYPVDYGTTADDAPSSILQVWAREDSANQVVSFCVTLALHYQCFWPQEGQVQEGAHSLALSLAKRGTQVRSLLLASPSFTQMVTFHCLTAGMRHNAPRSELEALVQTKVGGSISMDMVCGYQRLPYKDKSRILTALLMATCDTQNETAKAMFTECLTAVHSAFSSLVQALASKQLRPDNVDAQEMACLCVIMYGGVARAGEINEMERIPQVMTPSLPQLSGLMTYYATDLTICEALLRLFRDYTEQFVAVLNREQSLALFQASADLLKSYSQHHCSSRVIQRSSSSAEVDAEEEQSYSDVLSAIQLLIHLGTKDFIDICTSGVDSNQVTDVIFFGLQQIIPLMTQGLLQFPTLCTQYFSLVGFMMDTYPDKVCVLPYELFDALLESLLFGMSHLDTFVSKSSLQGIAGLAREHLKSKALAPHLLQHPDIFDKCCRRLLQDVVFQSIVWDRLEPGGMALLPLAAVDPQRFVNVVNGLTQQVPAEQQARLQQAFDKLINVDILRKVSSGGYEGRMNRVRFKKDFDEFVKEVHSFLLVK